MFTEDFSAYLNAAEFSVPATLAGGEVVQVIFDDAYQPGLANLMESSQPTAIGRSSELAALSHGDELQIAERSYVLAGSQPDGTGLTRLMLERQP